jgi:hypothetical protein
MMTWEVWIRHSAKSVLKPSGCPPLAIWLFRLRRFGSAVPVPFPFRAIVNHDNQNSLGELVLLFLKLSDFARPCGMIAQCASVVSHK